MGRMTRVAVLDYGSGNIHSALRMLARVGADVELTSEAAAVHEADGLLVPGVGNFHACMKGLAAAGGPELIRRRLADGRPVLGVCVGMQVMFDGSDEPSVEPVAGLGLWGGTVTRLAADVVPHMGWSEVEPPAGSTLFQGVAGERFYFVHSYAFAGDLSDGAIRSSSDGPLLTHAQHGHRFVAAVEDGALCATQFHPEKSGDAGAALLTNWVRSL